MGQQVRLLDVLATLMNQMVLQLMMEGEDGRVERHASEAALEGYCAFYHLLLFLSSRFPHMARTASSVPVSLSLSHCVL